MEQNFTQNDIISITNRGNTVATLEKQLQYFKNGITKINLLEYASVPNGIWAFDTEEKQSLIAYFDKHKNNYDIVKFVPASGAVAFEGDHDSGDGIELGVWPGLGVHAWRCGLG